MRHVDSGGGTQSSAPGGRLEHAPVEFALHRTMRRRIKCGDKGSSRAWNFNFNNGNRNTNTLDNANTNNRALCVGGS